MTTTLKPCTSLSALAANSLSVSASSASAVRASRNRMIAPMTMPTTADKAALTIQFTTPPIAGSASAAWCAVSWIRCGRVTTPNSSIPWTMICPPTHSIAAVPISASAFSRTGIALTSPRPIACAAALDRWARARPISSIFTISATTP